MKMAPWVVFILSQTALAGLFGEDDRRWVDAAAPAAIQELAKSVAVHVPRSRIQNFDDRLAKTYLADAPRYSDEWLTCSGVRFGDEPALPDCTGFLVGTSTLLTAGHCGSINAAGCANSAWVFDYRRDAGLQVLASPSGARSFEIHLSGEQLYRCQHLLAAGYDPDRNIDFALVQLDRPVTGRKPLRMRYGGGFTGREKLFTLGAMGGTFLVYTQPQSVLKVEEATLSGPFDLIARGSGGPFVDAVSGEVVGIAVRSNVDFISREERRWIESGKAGDPPAHVPNSCNVEYIRSAPWLASERDHRGVLREVPYTHALRLDYLERHVPFLSFIY